MTDVVSAGAALELLHAYLLVHDDWMDEDDVRRGGPSVHAMLRERFGSAREGETAAILAGDFAASVAQSALFELALPADRVIEAAREFARIQEDVVYGQLLDTRAGADRPETVEAMHQLKTGSYTVRGPLMMGAILAGASKTQRDGLSRFAEPLGVAFQLRDDLLGTFGDPAATGKPFGSDLRQGKRTALVVELGEDPLLATALGVKDASEAAVARVVDRMKASGAKARVEARLAALMKEAASVLDDASLLPLAASAREVLRGAVLALGERES